MSGLTCGFSGLPMDLCDCHEQTGGFCTDSRHTSWSGVDQNWGPDKVWRCDECGLIVKVPS